jgi:hypothetical protein
MNARNKSPGDKASNGKKSKKERNAREKQKTVAVGMAAPVMRDEAVKRTPPPSRAQASAPRTETKAKPAFAAKPPTKPQAKPVARADPKPAAQPKPPAHPKPTAQPKPAAQPKPVVQPKPRDEIAPAPREAVVSAAETMERSLKAAGAGTLAVNRKLIDFAQENVTCSLGLVKDLAAARNPMRVMRLQMDYWHDCLANFASQAEALRALSAEFVANANEPIREHLRKSRGSRLNRH